MKTVTVHGTSRAEDLTVGVSFREDHIYVDQMAGSPLMVPTDLIDPLCAALQKVKAEIVATKRRARHA